MERPPQRNVDDPRVVWEDLALSQIDGVINPYKVASVGEVPARHLLEALAEDRASNRTPETRKYQSVLSLVNVPGWDEKAVLNMVAANWMFHPCTSGHSAADDPETGEPKENAMVKLDQAQENSFAWFTHE